MYFSLALKKLNFNFLSKLVLLFVLLVALLTFKDYGVTWDEAMQHTYGQNVVNYYLSGRTDLSFQNFRDLYLYGGLFDSGAYLLAQFTSKLNILTLFETRHLLNALVGWLGLVGVYQVGKLIYGARGGFFSLLSILLIPVYYGHLFANPKDIPFATFFIWGIYAILRYLRSLKAPSFWLSAFLGIMIGLSLGVRLGGLLLFPPLILGIIVNVLIDQRKESWPHKFSLLWSHAQNLIIIVTLAYSLLLIFWPYGQEGLRHNQPVSTITEAFGAISNFAGSGVELVHGQYVDITRLPWWYLPVWFGISLPILFFALLPLGILAVFLLTRVRQRLHFATVVLLLLYLIVPYLFVLYKHSVLYDAQRHFLFMFPLLAVLAGGGLELALRYLSGFKRSALVFTFFVFGAQIVVTEVQLHPYQTLYFNQLAGGLKGASGRYELDYWGSSYKEAALWLNAYYEKKDLNKSLGNKVFTCGDANSVIPFLQKLEWTAEEQKADFVICPSFDPKLQNLWLVSRSQWQEIKSIERLGVPINNVYEKRIHQN